MVIRASGNSQKPHCLLLYPKTGLDLGSTVAPPHALLTVAAPVKKAGYAVALLDQRVEPITKERLAALVSSDLMAVGISTMTGSQVWFALGLAKLVREVAPHVPIVWGGCHPSVTAEQTLAHPLVDIVAIGEGDYTMLDILEALGAHRSLCHVPGILYKDGPTPVKTLPRSLLNVEELLPVPWELVDPEKYIHRDMYLRDKVRVLDIGQTSRGCPFDCVSADMTFATEDGVFYPLEMAGGGMVVCGEGHRHEVGTFGRHPVASKGVQPCVAVELDNGLRVEVTPTHRIMAVTDERPSWVEARDLVPGQYVALEIGGNSVRDFVRLEPPQERPRQRRRHSVPAVLDEDVAWLAGYLIGDGSLPKDGRAAIHFAVTESTEAEVRNRLKRCFGYEGLSTRHSQTDKCRNLWVYSASIRDFFEQSVGISCIDKLRVPLSIRRSPKNVVAAFLCGLWAADGYWPRNGRHPHLCTISEVLAREVAAVAAWIGLAPTVFHAPPAGIKGTRLWRVLLCHAGCAEDVSGRGCLGSFVPTSRRIYRSHKSGSYFWRSGGGKRRGVTRGLLRKIEPNHVLLAHGGYARVITVVPIGSKPTFDLSVCPTHQFSAAGIIVHNCAFCSSASLRERKWRAQSVDRVLDDLKEAVARFQLDGWWWRDDEFYIKRKRAHAIMEGIVQAGIKGSFYTSGTRCDVFAKATDEEVQMMKRAGAHTLKFGAESGSQRVLDLMQKGITVEQTLAANQRCKAHGITPAFALMIGYPTETFEEMDQTIDLGYRLKRENPQAELETMCQYTPLPGTPDWHLALKHGLQSPQSLEEWTSWQFDEYDLEGRKSPWFPRKERRWLGNISYTSILANALENAVASVRNPWIRIPASLVVKPAARYFKWRLSTHRYRWMPELELVRILREKIFYRSTQTIS